MLKLIEDKRKIKNPIVIRKEKFDELLNDLRLELSKVKSDAMNYYPNKDIINSYFNGYNDCLSSIEDELYSISTLIKLREYRLYDSTYYNGNKEYFRKYYREYYKNNRALLLKKSKDYKKNNINETIIRNKDYRTLKKGGKKNE